MLSQHPSTSLEIPNSLAGPARAFCAKVRVAMGHKERIQQLLIGKPGLKAQQIAAELGLEKAHVATALHGFSSAEMVQDSSYRWWPRMREASGESRGAETDPHPLLSRLCRYYLDCLSRESA